VDCWVADDVVGGVGRALGALAEGTAYDGFVVAVDTPADPPTSYIDMGRGIVAAAVALAKRDPRPVVIATTAIAADDPAVLDQLRAAGLPRLLGLASGFKAWGAIVRAQERHRHWTRAPESRRPPLDDLLPDTEPAAYAALAQYGIAVPRHRNCRSHDEALAAAAAIGYPVVAKLVSRRILHKTEVGGVRTGLADEAAVAAAVDTLLPMPGAEAVLIAEMVEPGIDLLIGARIDPQLGPMVMLGLGGIWAELLDDATLLPAPLLPAAVEAALAGTRLDRLLAGFRGQPPANREALCATAARLGDLVAALSLPDLAIDLNPVRVLRDRVIVLDAKFVPPAAAQQA
jgi:acyl-CoA synthetase (NDP forming)